MLVRADGAHAAGLGARALLLDDGVIGADILAAAALDALGLVDDRTAVDDVDGVLGADLGARMRQAALAAVGHDDLLFRAGVAGELDDIDERRLIVRFARAVLDAVRDGRVGVGVARRKTHGQAQALANNGALEEDAVAVSGVLGRQDLVGQGFERLGKVLGLCLVGALEGHARDLGVNATANLVDACVNSSHAGGLLSRLLIFLSVSCF